MEQLIFLSNNGPATHNQGIKLQFLSKQKNNSLVFQRTKQFIPQMGAALRLPFDETGFLFLSLFNEAGEE